MKFLVKWRPMPMSPEMMKTVPDVIFAEIEYQKVLKEKGKVLAMYTFAGGNEGFGILDVKSHEELIDILAKEPIGAMVSFEAIPIVDFEYSLKVFKEVYERAVK
jgi:muconolactone delta-isomerase